MLIPHKKLGHFPKISPLILTTLKLLDLDENLFANASRGSLWDVFVRFEKSNFLNLWEHFVFLSMLIPHKKLRHFDQNFSPIFDHFKNAGSR